MLRLQKGFSAPIPHPKSNRLTKMSLYKMICSADSGESLVNLFGVMSASCAMGLLFDSTSVVAARATMARHRASITRVRWSRILEACSTFF